MAMYIAKEHYGLTPKEIEDTGRDTGIQRVRESSQPQPSTSRQANEDNRRLTPPAPSIQQRVEGLIRDAENAKARMNEVPEFKQSFHMFDQNGDGKITLTELGNVMRTLGQNPSESDLKQMIRELDSDKSGCVEFHEFLQMYARKKKAVGPTDEEDEVRAAFKTFDRDGDGYISTVELRQVMVSLGEKLSQKEVEEMINAADVDGNGRIDYSEFVKMILKK